MSLRTAIRDMLTGGDPTALSDVPADEVAQALTNYADTASLAEADALAPIVTRASHVPFDEEIDGDLGAPLVDVHADLASLDPVEPSAVDDDGDTLDPGDGIDDAPVGNEHASDDTGSDAEILDEHDDANLDDAADLTDSTDVDPDGWFDAEPTEAVPQAAGLDDASPVEAPMVDDAVAFGTGTTSAGPDAETVVELDEVDPAFETQFETGSTFDEVAIEADVINELPTDDVEFDPGIISDDVEVDDGPADDSFGDVDFDI